MDKERVVDRFLKWFLSNGDKSRVLDKIALVYFFILFMTLLVFYLIINIYGN